MSSPSQHQPTCFTNHNGKIGVQAGQYNVYGTSIVQQSQDPLSQLPNATDAPTYSYAHQHEDLCLDDTRVDLRNMIDDWADRRDERCIFWVSGLAGTGKSTIARTVERKYHKEKRRLAASFFFSRGGGEDVRCAKKFVTSLAKQLAQNVEASKQLINEAIIKCGDIANHPLIEQWDHLILGPLSKLRDGSCPASLILVVDALDECEDERDICLIVRLLAKARSLTKVQLRILLTSRPEPPISTEFDNLQKKHQVVPQKVVLHDMPELVVNHDIYLFLRHEFERYRQNERIEEDWPDSEAIGGLVQKASGLFIWAATAFRFICGGVDIDERLRMLLEGERHERCPEAHLDSIYITVLQASVRGNYSLQERQKYYTDLRTLLASIVALFSPLSVEALSKVLGFRKRYVNRMLKGLHAILAVPPDDAQVLRLHHPSFRDFLLSGDRCSDANFKVDGKAAHRDLAQKCLQLMSSSLQQGDCGIRAVGTLVTEDADAQFKPSLPSELQYACHYWIHHLVRGGTELLDSDHVHKFLREHFLHWLEALGWMAKISEGIDAINVLESMALRFVLYNRSGIEQAPLQVYCSALVFAPSESIVKKQFADKIPRWIKKPPQVDSSWSALLQTLEGHKAVVYGVTFSPDSKVLASASRDNTVKLWDVGTGALRQTLENQSHYNKNVLFSPDGKIIASKSIDGTVELWKACTGGLWTLSGQLGRAEKTAFSPNSEWISISQYDLVELWNVSVGERSRVFRCYPDAVWAVTSPEGTPLAYTSSGMSISVRDVRTGKVIRTIECHAKTPTALTPDGKILAFVSRNETIKLWDVTTGAILQELEDISGNIEKFILSSDGTMLASQSHGVTLKLWDVGTGELVQTFKSWPNCPLALSHKNKALAFISSKSPKVIKVWKAGTRVVSHTLKGHSNDVEDLAFSPDGKVLASTSYDGTVRLWNAVMDTVGQMSKRYSECVDMMAFSPNGKVLASILGEKAFRDQIIELWDVTSGSEKRAIKRPSAAIVLAAFSPDGKILASIPRCWEPGKNAIDLWKGGTYEVLQTLEGHSDLVLAVAFSPDSKQLASASRDKTVRIWNTGTSEALTLGEHFDCVSAVAFSPNGQILVSASLDKTVKIWNVDKSELQYELDGHAQSVREVAFSADGRVLASLAHYKDPCDKRVHGEEVKLWDASTGNLLQTLQSHPEFSLALLLPDVVVPVVESGIGKRNMWDANLGAVPQNRPADAVLSTLSYYGSPTFLRTYRGPTSTGFSFTTSSPKLKSPPEVFISEQWMFHRGFRVLWLPPDYRATCVAVYDDVVAIGHDSGLVSLLEISDIP